MTPTAAITIQGIFDTSLINHSVQGVPAALALIDEVVSGRLRAGISAVSVYELWLTRPFTAAVQLAFEARLALLTVLPVDREVAAATAEALRDETRERRGRLFHDAVIAHTAKALGVPVWTGDQDFRGYGAQVNRYLVAR